MTDIRAIKESLEDAHRTLRHIELMVRPSEDLDKENAFILGEALAYINGANTLLEKSMVELEIIGE